MIDDIGTNYATPISAANIDENLVAVKMEPDKIGEPAIASIEDGYTLVADVITSQEPTCFKLGWEDGKIFATGGINAAESFAGRKIAPICHEHYLQHKLKTILSALNIKHGIKNWKIKVVNNSSHIPVNAQRINEVESLALAEIIKPMLQISSNLIADALYLTIIHAHASEEIKEWAQGDAIIKKLLKEHFSLETTGALFVDGSGLSRYNRVQPTQLFALLKKGFSTAEFVEALPLPGAEKSTLKKRQELKSTIRAKTGGMSGINCLCGYNLTPNPKAFVFINNSFAPPASYAHKITDTFINKSVSK
jgi:D-alanyl-D-alanine carboxypeptidase/D-alanyl-D-alanine-endopeptidase (penicillin-binding protein 4)